MSEEKDRNWYVPVRYIHSHAQVAASFGSTASMPHWRTGALRRSCSMTASKVASYAPQA